MNWAHVHLMLSHLPVVGTILGVLLLLLALVRKSEELKRVSLGVFVLTALLALPVYFTGEPAEKVVEHIPDITEPLIERHENAALFALLMAGVTGVVALAGLILFRRAERVPGWIVAATLVLLSCDQRGDGVDGQSRRADSPHGNSRRFQSAGRDGD